MGAVDPLVRGREAYGRLAWRDAYEQLADADRRDPLDSGDLERLAQAAYLVGALDAAMGAWERSHHAHLDRGDAAAAARCAFWLGLTLFLQGEHARGGGWLGRAQRILQKADRKSVV